MNSEINYGKKLQLCEIKFSPSLMRCPHPSHWTKHHQPNSISSLPLASLLELGPQHKGRAPTGLEQWQDSSHKGWDQQATSWYHDRRSCSCIFRSLSFFHHRMVRTSTWTTDSISRGRVKMRVPSDARQPWSHGQMTRLTFEAVTTTKFKFTSSHLFFTSAEGRAAVNRNFSIYLLQLAILIANSFSNIAQTGDRIIVVNVNLAHNYQKFVFTSKLWLSSLFLRFYKVTTKFVTEKLV